MQIVCDADGLIKLHKAGILDVLARYARLLVGPEVYRETVEEGKTRGYPDAFEIEELVPRPTHPAQGSLSQEDSERKQEGESAQVERLLGERSLGKGEREAFQLYFSEGADAILSDDRAFLNFLESQELPYLTPAAALVLLVEEKVLAVEAALEALERMRPFIREAQRQAALRDLQTIESTSVPEASPASEDGLERTD